MLINYKLILEEMSKYLLLNQAFCEAHQGYTNSTGMFGYGITIQGWYVAAEQSLIDFRELFENSIYLTGIPIIELSVSDFPQQTVN